jgi:hypothetical protein
MIVIIYKIFIEIHERVFKIIHAAFCYSFLLSALYRFIPAIKPIFDRGFIWVQMFGSFVKCFIWSSLISIGI